MGTREPSSMTSQVLEYAPVPRRRKHSSLWGATALFLTLPLGVTILVLWLGDWRGFEQERIFFFRVIPIAFVCFALSLGAILLGGRNRWLGLAACIAAIVLLAFAGTVCRA